jgi:phospholipid/cholesterol/gamma-HCH transport system permease protein
MRAIPASRYEGPWGYFALLRDVVLNLPALARPAVRDMFARQIQITGEATLSALVIRAAGLGTLIIAYMIHILSADAAYAVRILIWAVLREIGPLFAAMMLIMRSGTMLAAEFAEMRGRGELDRLRMMGIDPLHYLVVPTVAAVTVSSIVVTFYFQILAVGGGILISALLMDVTLNELAEHFFALAGLSDILYTLIKSAGFGIGIGLVLCAQGLGGSSASVAQIISRSVMQSIFAVLLFNAVFAYLVFGVALFGIVKAP